MSGIDLADTTNASALNANALSAADFTIVLCTRNRAGLLPGAVGSLLHQQRGEHPCKLLIVDNGSTDATRSTCEQLREQAAQHGVGLRYTFCPAPGLSRARNSALSTVDTEFVIFFDDDQIADPGWFQAYALAMKNANERVACFGGPMHLSWQSTAPSWLPESLHGYLSSLDYGRQHCQLDPTQRPVFGGNMGFRVSALRDVNGFANDMGHNAAAGRLLGNEEIEVQLRLHRLGYVIQYIPDATIQHLVLPERLSRDWFSRRIHDQAVADTRIRRKILGHSRLRLAGSALKLWWLRSSANNLRNAGKHKNSEQARVLGLMNRQRLIGSLRGVLELP